jgi:hypothetical protein
MNLLQIKPAGSFASIYDCDSFIIMKSEPQKRKAISIQEKMDTPAPVDAKKDMSHWLPD